MPQPSPKQPSGPPAPAPRPAAQQPEAGSRPRIDARAGDVECLVGLATGRYTVASAPLWLGVAVALTAFVMLVMAKAMPESYLYVMMDRCWTNWAVLLFSFWCLGILGAKATKTAIQMRALRVTDLVPRRGDFVLSPGTAGDVLRRIRAVADRPKDFLLFRRIDMALSNLGNIGEVRDVGAVLESQADSDASSVDSSYTVVRSLIWTIPILGFIGTVVGLSQAIGSFSAVLSASSTDTKGIKEKLLPVVEGLSTAFETTLVALLAAVMIQLLSTWVYKREEALLDGLTDYTNEHVLSRLKLTDWQ
jgi:biopolymer transport protein ExbB/TolQ